MHIYRVPSNETSQPGPNRLLSGGCDRMFEYYFPLLRTIVEISENRIKKYKKKRGRRTFTVKKVILSLPVVERTSAPFLRVHQLRGLYVTEIATERWENSAVVKEGLLFPFRTCIRRKRPHERHAEMFASAALAKKKKKSRGKEVLYKEGTSSICPNPSRPPFRQFR